jgi:NAD(P)-dependent dehydrogenase (short-subunit alcohol dehydrogenase family)
MRFEGRVVVVTGAARGMGRAIAAAFATEGAQVALWGRTGATVAATAAEIGGGAFGLACDVAEAAQVEAALAETLRRAGRIDAMVANAGIAGPPVPTLAMTAEAWDGVMAVNLRGAMLCAVGAARVMAAAGRGSIVLNASIAARARDGAYGHYSAAKAGLIALMRTMAVELAPHGIRVNSVSPGYVRTEMTLGGPASQEAERRFADWPRVPMRRLIEPGEIAEAVLWLASDAASAVTGHDLVVDAGMTANLYILETLEGIGEAGA